MAAAVTVDQMEEGVREASTAGIEQLGAVATLQAGTTQMGLLPT